MRRWWAQLDRDERDRLIAYFIAAMCASVVADLVEVLIDLSLLGESAILLVVFIPAAVLARTAIRRRRGLRDRSTDVRSDGT